MANPESAIDENSQVADEGKTSLDEINQAKEEQEDIVAEVRNKVKKFRTHYSNWRTNAKVCYDMYASRQWTDDEIKILEEQGRPDIAFNRICRIVNCVSGFELQNRQDITCLPFGVEDAGLSDLGNSAMSWVRNETDSEDEESEAYEDMLICGLGGTYTHVEYETDPDGKISDSRIDPFMLAFDWTAKKKNAEDTKWRAVAIKYTKNDFYATFPEAKEMVKSGTSLFDEATITTDNGAEDYSQDNNTNQPGDKNMIEVIYYQCYELEPFYRVVDIVSDPTTGQNTESIKELSVEDFKMIKDQLDANNMKYVRQSKRVYKQYIIAGGNLLDENPAPINGFSIEIMTGLRDRNTNTWFGLVSLMLDPQRWANKWLSQVMHILNSNAKGGYLFETGSFVDPSKAETDMARPDKNVEVNPGKLDRIIPKPQPQMPPELNALLQYAIGAISECPGVSEEMLGLVGHEQAGVVEDSRKNAGLTVLAQFSNALRKFKKKKGAMTMQFIQDYISDGRIIRIDEKNGRKYVKLLKDKLATKYDIIIDDAPASANTKDKVFRAMMQILPLALQAGVPVPPELLDYLPLPQAFIDDWKKYIETNANNPEKQQATALNFADKQAEINKKNSGAVLDKARAVSLLKGDSPNIEDNLINRDIEGLKLQGTKIKSATEIMKSNKSENISKLDLIGNLHTKQNKPITNQPENQP